MDEQMDGVFEIQIGFDTKNKKKLIAYFQGDPGESGIPGKSVSVF